MKRRGRAVKVATPAQSRRRVAYLRAIGCKVFRKRLSFGTVILRRCPKGTRVRP